MVALVCYNGLNMEVLADIALQSALITCPVILARKRQAVFILVDEAQTVPLIVTGTIVVSAFAHLAFAMSCCAGVLFCVQSKRDEALEKKDAATNVVPGHPSEVGVILSVFITVLVASLAIWCLVGMNIYALDKEKDSKPWLFSLLLFVTDFLFIVVGVVSYCGVHYCFQSKLVHKSRTKSTVATDPSQSSHIQKQYSNNDQKLPNNEPSKAPTAGKIETREEPSISNISNSVSEARFSTAADSSRVFQATPNKMSHLSVAADKLTVELESDMQQDL
uniref:MARVEL domain-containing protein n=1 Tax=Steinernema glaseri TaxID=37863 RepID=A0A1I7YVP1_9BILA